MKHFIFRYTFHAQMLLTLLRATGDIRWDGMGWVGMAGMLVEWKSPKMLP